jgi:site-specific recombinase XerD
MRLEGSNRRLSLHWTSLAEGNYSQTTARSYVKTVEDFARHFHRSPEKLGPDEIRAYQVYLLQEKKQGVRTVGNHTAALRAASFKRLYPK